MTILVCHDQSSIDVLSSAIGGAHAVEHLADLRRHLAAHPDDLVVIGPDIDLAAAVEFTADARIGQPALGVLLVRHRVDTGVLTQALQAGFRAVVAVQETQRLGQACAVSRQVSDGVRRAAGMAPTPTGASRGRTVTIFSGKGGVGKSTIATDVGVALVQSGVRTCLVDLDLAFGDVAVMLGLLPLRTLTDAVSMAGDLDAAGAAALVTPHSSGLHVILAPAEPRGAEDVSAELVSRLLPLLTDLYDVVLVDTPPAFTEDVLAALDASDEVVLVTTPEVPSIKNLKLTLQTLDLIGYPADRRRIVLNRADPQLGIGAADVTAMIGVDVQIEVPADRAVPISINHGVPIVLEQPKHPISRALRQLAAAVRGGAPQPVPDGVGRSAGRAVGRRGLLRRKESAR
jgi:pilus assembly protein CpaE